MITADYELIDKKIESTLTPEEDRRFAERMAHEPAFAEAYRTQRQAIDALRTHHARELRQEVRHLYARVQHQRQRRVRWYYAAAAGLVGVIGVAAYWFSLAPTSEQLYASYYTVYPAYRATRGGDSSAYDRGLSLYNQGQYAEALPYLERLPEVDSLRDRVNLLLGNAYLQTDQPTRARETLSAVAASDDTLLQQQGQWYLALSYLKQHHVAAARPILEELAAAGMYRKEAHEILERVDIQTDEEF